MAQIAQQDNRIVNVGNSYYKERGYPIQGDTDEDYGNDLLKFLMYKAWKLGIFYDTILQNSIILDSHIEHIYMCLSNANVVTSFYKENKVFGKDANKLAGLSVLISNKNFIIDEGDIARYDEIIEWEQNRPAAE